ncbi:MAG: YggS family pyridoxal phosphate-dependent enzyme [Deltaproteobacteria bacterium]
MNSIKENIEAIRFRIKQIVARINISTNPVKIMAVTKTVNDDKILQAIDAGIELIGENYVQEAQRKQKTIFSKAQMHLIGHLQSNKAKYAVQLFDMIHSVDRIELAKELDKRAKSIAKKQNILIEINTSGEVTKSGISPEMAIPLIREITSLNNLRICGLMTMPPYFEDPQSARKYFIALRNLRDEIITQKIDNVFMEELSMGMSDDFEVAIEEGATIVRIGRAIFGKRVAKQ